MDNQDSKKSFLDKVTDLTNLVNKDNQPKPTKPEELVNARTQSMIVSDREQAAQELSEMQAMREQQAHNEVIEANIRTVKKTGVYVIITAICVILIILVAILVFTLIPYLRRPDKTPIVVDGGGDEKVFIDFYECHFNDCKELTTFPDGRILIHDGNYIILNDETEETFTTAISGDYEAADVFDWGEKTYAFMKPAEGSGAIFSITDNKNITEDSYAEVYSDIENEVYVNQKWIEGQYIIAKRSGDYRLIDITNGREKVQGTKGVLAIKSGFFMAYDENGNRRVYNNSNTQITLVESGGIFTRDSYIVVIYDDGNYSVYNNDGQTEEFEFKDELRSVDREQLLETVEKDSKYTKLPD